MHRLILAGGLTLLAACQSPPTPKAAPTPADLARGEMRTLLGELPGTTYEQTHGPFLLSVRTEAKAAVRINRFMTTLLAEMGP